VSVTAIATADAQGVLVIDIPLVVEARVAAKAEDLAPKVPMPEPLAFADQPLVAPRKKQNLRISTTLHVSFLPSVLHRARK
jgi:hypothetical protein